MKNNVIFIILALLLTPVLVYAEEVVNDRKNYTSAYKQPIYVCLLAYWDKIPIYADEMDEEPIEFIHSRTENDSILYVTIVDKNSSRLKIEYGVVSACDTVTANAEKTGWVKWLCSGQLNIEGRSLRLYEQADENSSFEDFFIYDVNDSAETDVRNLSLMLMDVYGDFRYVIFVTHGKIHKGWIKRRYGDILWFWWSDTL